MKKIRMISLILALLAAAVIFTVLQRTKDTETVTVKVVFAVNDITENTVITKDHLKVKAIPEDMVVPGCYSDMEQLVGKIANTDIKAGEQILSSRISEFGNSEKSSLNLLVEEGYRAISIPVTDVTGISNMIHPGDKVDVLGHVEIDKEEPQAEGQPAQTSEEEVKQEAITTTIVENVPVLAVDNITSTKGKSEQYTLITLMVTPEVANKIDWAVNEGLVRVILRTPLDETANGANKTNQDAFK